MLAADARRRMAKEERIADLVDYLEAVALNLPSQANTRPDAEAALRVHAADKALDRLEGKPRQVNENLNIATSFSELVKRSLKPKVV